MGFYGGHGTGRRQKADGVFRLSALWEEQPRPLRPPQVEQGRRPALSGGRLAVRRACRGAHRRGNRAPGGISNRGASSSQSSLCSVSACRRKLRCASLLLLSPMGPSGPLGSPDWSFLKGEIPKRGKIEIPLFGPSFRPLSLGRKGTPRRVGPSRQSVPGGRVCHAAAAPRFSLQNAAVLI